MDMTRGCLMAMVGVSLLDAGCNSSGTSRQEDLRRGIVRGTLEAQQSVDMRLPIPAQAFTLRGQVTTVEGGAYVLQEVSGAERRVAHDENTRIDRPVHVGDRIEVIVDDSGRNPYSER